MWLQHNSNATPVVDADIVIEATGQVIGTFAKLIRRREYGDPERCPQCESYRVREDIESDDDRMGFWQSDMCASCGWQSERVFTSLQDHFEGNKCHFHARLITVEQTGFGEDSPYSVKQAGPPKASSNSVCRAVRVRAGLNWGSRRLLR